MRAVELLPLSSPRRSGGDRASASRSHAPRHALALAALGVVLGALVVAMPSAEPPRPAAARSVAAPSRDAHAPGRAAWSARTRPVVATPAAASRSERARLAVSPRAGSAPSGPDADLASTSTSLKRLLTDGDCSQPLPEPSDLYRVVLAADGRSASILGPRGESPSQVAWASCGVGLIALDATLDLASADAVTPLLGVVEVPGPSRELVLVMLEE